MTNTMTKTPASETSFISRKQREFGIDLLKICAMFAIVLEHIIHWGGWGLFAPPCSRSVQWMGKSILFEFVEATLICHVNCFVLATGWIMSRKDFKLSRLLRLWLEVFGYSVAALLVAILFLPQIPLDVKSIMKCLFPLSKNSYWFFTQYCGLFFLMPLLNAAVGTLEGRTLRTVLLFLGVLACLPPLIVGDLFHVKDGYSVIWFAYLYLLAAAMARREVFSNASIRTALCVLLAAVFTTICGRHVIHVICIHAGIASRWRVFNAYNSPIILIQSVATLVVFKNIQVHSAMLRRTIAFVTPSVFAVYLIHSNWIFRAATHWNTFWTSALNGTGAMKSLAVVFCGASVVFIACLLVDFTRRGVKAVMRLFLDLYSSNTRHDKKRTPVTLVAFSSTTNH